MGQVRVCNMDDDAGFEGLRAAFEEAHPGLRMSRVCVDGDATLRAKHGGMRTFWLYGGEGEVLLEAGCRTKEGDGAPLPPSYRAETILPALARQLEYLEAHFDTLAVAAREPIAAILGRRNVDRYTGDYAGDLWKLCQITDGWTGEDATLEAIDRLFAFYRECGWSVKTESSFEPVIGGDQLVVAGDETLRVRGRFRCLSVEKTDRPSRHVAPAMRLRYLLDSSGGCNFSFDPFRRLPLTWHPPVGCEEGDGINFINSHVVNIAEETSPSHFHPPVPVNGGVAQNEMYLVLDPKTYGLNTYGRRARLVAYPDLRDLARFEVHDLRSGDFVFIPAGTGHRGIDVFVNVLTTPGFKPRNEYYIDAEIQERAPSAPYNASLTSLRNYEALEALLG